MKPTLPYISFVMAVRNDNYGENFNQRLQLCLTWLLYLLEKYQLKAEVLLINYNPIENQPSLKEIIQLPVFEGRGDIRLITVPNAIHLKMIQPNIRKTVPLFEFIAKNIGVRRARGEYILCTNADILFSENLIAFFSKKQLQPNTLYRCDRYDFRLKSNDLEKITAEKRELEFLIKKRVFKFFLQGGTFTLSFPSSLKLRLRLLNKYNIFRKFYYRMLLQTPGDRYFLFFPKIKPSQFFLFSYHCNASGDMALMDRGSWFRIKGYLEDTWISTHTDSLFVMSANAAGTHIKVLPDPVYHQHHERRFDFSSHNPDMDKMYSRLLNDVDSMRETQKPIQNKKESWGLSDIILREEYL